MIVNQIAAPKVIALNNNKDNNIVIEEGECKVIKISDDEISEGDVKMELNMYIYTYIKYSESSSN